MPFDQIVCSCGKPLTADAHWRDILDKAQFDSSVLDELRALEGAISRSGFLVRNGFSRNRLSADPRVQRFLTLQDQLLEAIAEVSGKPIVVDSSKAGPRAWLMACSPRTAVVHLHRDPADVLASWRSIKYDPGLKAPMKRLPIAAAALDWFKVDAMASKLVQAGGAIRLNYRDLCDTPRARISALQQQLGLADVAQPDWQTGDTFLPSADYHSLNGNPDRFGTGAQRIALRAPDWSALPWHERSLIHGTAAALRGVSFLIRTGG